MVLDRRLRLNHVQLVIAWLAVGYAVMPFGAANFMAGVGILCCLATVFARTSTTELFVALAFLIVFGWVVTGPLSTPAH